MQQTRPNLFRVPRDERLLIWLLGVIALLFLGWTLRAMAGVAVPVVFAVLATLFVAPLDMALKRFLPARLAWVAHLLAILTLFGGLVLFIGAIIFAAQQVLATMPNLADRVSDVMSGDAGAAEAAGLRGELRQIWNETGSMLGGWAVDTVTGFAQTTVTLTGVFTTSVFLILFTAFMALAEMGDWRGKMQTIWSSPSQAAWLDSLATVSQRLRQFLLLRSLVGVLQAALYIAWLAVFGVDLLLVWGILTFLLTYIPTLGSIIAGTLPVLYALTVFDPWTVLAIAAGLFVIEQVVGNYVDPVLLGQRLVLSPMVILVALLFWGWYWGIAGAFLATPIMLTLLILFNHVPALRPVALLLSNQCTAEDLDTALSR